MDIRNGDRYESLEAARVAGVPDDQLVRVPAPRWQRTVTRLKFLKGSFKAVQVVERGDGLAPAAPSTKKSRAEVAAAIGAIAALAGGR